VWAQIVGGLVLAPFALALDHRSGLFDARVAGWGLVAAVSAVLAYACLFFSMERGRLTVVVPVMSSWSVVAAALSLGILGETVRRAHLVGAGLIVTGVLVVSRFSQAALPVAAGDATPDSARRERGALLAAVGAAVGFGVLIPAIDRLAPVAGRLGAIPIVFLLDLVLGIPLALGARVNLRPPPRAAWGTVAAAGMFETVGFVWISLGAAHAPVAIVSPLAGLASAFTVLFAWLVLRERPPRLVLAGAALACAGVVILAL
jgi:drug/metabolite transporter (DMT)-like permease